MTGRRRGFVALLWDVLELLLAPFAWVAGLFRPRKRAVPTARPGTGSARAAQPSPAAPRRTRASDGALAFLNRAFGAVVGLVDGFLGFVVNVIFGSRGGRIHIPPAVSVGVVVLLLASAAFQGWHNLRIGAKRVVARYSPPPLIELPEERDRTPIDPPLPPPDPFRPGTPDPTPAPAPGPAPTPIPEPAPAPPTRALARSFNWTVVGVSGTFQQSFDLDEARVDATFQNFGASLYDDETTVLSRGIRVVEKRGNAKFYGPNYVWMLAENRRDVQSVAGKLAEMAGERGLTSQREVAAFLSGFAKSIPYCVPSAYRNREGACEDKGCEKFASPCQQDLPTWPRDRDEREHKLPYVGGVLMPLDTLARQWGDCDTKSLLIATLVANLPMRALLLTDDHHAMVALDLPPMRGETGFPFEGREWVVVEATEKKLAIGRLYTEYPRSVVARMRPTRLYTE